jgi:hypothetical protein
MPLRHLRAVDGALDLVLVAGGFGRLGWVTEVRRVVEGWRTSQFGPRATNTSSFLASSVLRLSSSTKAA